MMIERLQIRNFKCFKNTDLHFADLTILSGANGVGKSTVIQSLLLLRQLSDGVVEQQRSSGTEREALFVQVSLNDEYRLSLGNTAQVTNSDLDSRSIEFETTMRRGKAETFLLTAETEPLRTSVTYQGSWPENLPRTSIFAPEFHYLVAERVGPRDLYNVIDQPFINTGFAGEYTAYAISQCQQRHVSEELTQAEGTTLFLPQLEAWLDRVVPGIRINTRPFPEMNRVRVEIERKSTETGWLSPSNIGFGISYVLPIIVSGLLASKGSALIVENPEAHLHPAAQSAIGRFLTRVALSGVQVVVETHSEHVVNGARLEVLEQCAGSGRVRALFFDMPENGTEPNVSHIEVDDKSELSQWPLGFFDQQSQDITKLLRMRRGETGT